jgi:hypothetical protein
MTLELPPDLEERVNREAARQGLSPSEYVIELVRSATPEEPSADEAPLTPEEVRELLYGAWPEDEPRPSNGAELVAYWERHGLLGTRTDIPDSLEHPRQLRHKVEERERTDHDEAERRALA